MVPDNFCAALAAEERKWAQQDRIRDAYPRCICCGHSIYDCEKFRQIGDLFICGDCDAISEVGLTANLEV